MQLTREVSLYSSVNGSESNGSELEVVALTDRQPVQLPRSSVALERRGAWITTRASEFWTRWRRRSCVERRHRADCCSSRDMHAPTILTATDLAASSVRRGRMWRRARIWKLQELTMLYACRSIESAWLSSTPRSLTVSENGRHGASHLNTSDGIRMHFSF